MSQGMVVASAHPRKSAIRQSMMLYWRARVVLQGVEAVVVRRRSGRPAAAWMVTVFSECTVEPLTVSAVFVRAGIGDGGAGPRLAVHVEVRGGERAPAGDVRVEDHVLADVAAVAPRLEGADHERRVGRTGGRSLAGIVVEAVGVDVVVAGRGPRAAADVDAEGVPVVLVRPPPPRRR